MFGKIGVSGSLSTSGLNVKVSGGGGLNVPLPKGSWS